MRTAPSKSSSGLDCHSGFELTAARAWFACLTCPVGVFRPQPEKQLVNPGSLQQGEGFLDVLRLAAAFPHLVITELTQLGQALHLVVGQGSRIDAYFHAIKRVTMPTFFRHAQENFVAT
jgi:hypothetical protein